VFNEVNRKAFMRKFLSLAALILTVASSGLQADIFTDSRSGLQFPEEIGKFKRSEVKTYEYEPGKQGVAVGYGHETTAITIFVRATPPDMSHLTSADFVQESVVQIKEMAKQGHFANLKFSELPAAAEIKGWNTVVFTGETQGTEVDSFIACKAMPGYLVKIRATTGQGGGGDFMAFFTSLKDTLNKGAK
jgi:hypothetical protein